MAYAYAMIEKVPRVFSLFFVALATLMEVVAWVFFFKNVDQPVDPSLLFWMAVASMLTLGCIVYHSLELRDKWREFSDDHH
jgi:hypothetical protein